MQVVFGLIGAGVGSLLGNPLLGWSIGTLVGGALFGENETTGGESGRIGDQRIQGATQGTPIAIVYGRQRVAGNIIWAPGITETESTSTSGGKKGGMTTTNVVNTTSLAVMIARGNPTTRADITLRRIWANNEVVWSHRPELSETVPVISEKLGGCTVTFYPGDESQSADPTIQADKGASNTPAFLGRAYAVLDTMYLNKLGNGVPNLAFEIDSGTWNAEEVLLDIWSMCGGDEADCDFSAVAGITVAGFIIPARTEARAVMAALGDMHSFDIVEYDGLLRAVLRSGASAYTISYDELGGSSGRNSAEPVRRISITRTQEVELPVSETVNYHSEANDFQQFSQRADILTKTSDEESQISFQAVLTDAAARTLAEIRLRSKWAERSKLSFVTTYRMLKMVPGDVATLEIKSGGALTSIIKILRVEGIAPGLIRVDAKSYDPDVFTQDVAAAGVDSTPGEVFEPGPTVYAIAECNAAYDSIASPNEVFLVGVAGRIGGGWMGGAIWASEAMGSYEGAWERATFTSRSTFGTVTGEIATGDHHTIDDAETITVVLTSGAGLLSVTREALLQGANMALCGKEIICFETATETAENTYQLTGLRRGLRGTEQQMENHTDGEVFILLDGTEKWFAFYPSYIGTTYLEYYFRDVGSATFLTSIVPDAPQGLTRRPYSPVLLTSVRTAGVDAELSWTRRARINGDIVDYGDSPLDEASEVYILKVYSFDGVTLKRTETVSSATAFTYTVAMQTTDFGAESAFSFKVAQYTEACGIGAGEYSEFLPVAL